MTTTTKQLNERIDEMRVIFGQKIDAIQSIINEIAERKKVVVLFVGRLYVTRIDEVSEDVRWHHAKSDAVEIPADEAKGWCEYVKQITGIAPFKSKPFVSTKNN